MDAVIVCMVILLVAMILLVLAPLAAAAREEAKEARERGELSQFDERQRTLRCRAALHSLVVVLIYLVVWAFLDLCGITWAKESFVCAMLAVVLAFGVWMGECILRDVAIGWNIKQENRRLPLYVLFLSNIGISFAYNFPHTRIKIVAAAFAITGASMLMLQSFADHRRKKREANVCEEVDAP